MDTMLLLSACAIFFLLLLSAFFSGSETALTAASRARMLARAKEGNKRAATVNEIREHKDRMIGALLLGNNLVNILASALATSVLIKLFGETGVVYATLVMTLLVLIFAEVLPKTYAFHAADKMAMAIAPIMKIVILVLAPITALVTKMVQLVMKLLRIDISASQGDHVEILRGVIEMHEGSEQEVQDQRAMLRSVLDLVEVEVEEVMTHRKNVIMVDANLPTEKIVTEVLECPYTRLPVWQDEMDNIIGIIHVRALLKELQAHGGKVSKIDIKNLITEPWFIPDSTTLYDQLQEFRKRREHFAAVVDEYGSFMGIVTLEDILEEIVGEVEDEYDKTVKGVRRQSNGTYLVDGTVTIRDLHRELEWNLPDADYSTVAGLILHETQMIPEAGQTFQFYGFTFEIVRRMRNQITLLRITPPEQEQSNKDVA